MPIRETLATYLTIRRDAALSAFDLLSEIGAEIVAPLRFTLAVATQRYAQVLHDRGKARASAEMGELSSILMGYVLTRQSKWLPRPAKPPMLVPVMVMLEPGQCDVEVKATPKQLSLISAARAFMEPGVVATSIRPTLLLKDHATASAYGDNPDRLAGELDLHYFAMDEGSVPFDFGAADPEHPIVFRVSNKTDKPRQVNMVLFADPIDEDGKLSEIIKARFASAQMQ